MINVPNLIGKREDAAYQALLDAGLTGSAIEYRYDSSIEYGYVISQTASGQVEQGTSVGFVISMGPEQTTPVQPPEPSDPGNSGDGGDAENDYSAE